MTAPAHKIRISNLFAVIRRNSGERGPWYSVQLNRSDKPDDDDWCDAEALGYDYLLPEPRPPTCRSQAFSSPR